MRLKNTTQLSRSFGKIGVKFAEFRFGSKLSPIVIFPRLAGVGSLKLR